MSGAEQQDSTRFSTHPIADPTFTVAPATTAADLLAIERSLNEGLRKELDHTHAALTAALAMLTPEQSANLITKLQDE